MSLDILPGLKAGDSYRVTHSVSLRRVPAADGSSPPSLFRDRRPRLPAVLYRQGAVTVEFQLFCALRDYVAVTWNLLSAIESYFNQG
jgi:hypothetical protein